MADCGNPQYYAEDINIESTGAIENLTNSTSRNVDSPRQNDSFGNGLSELSKQLRIQQAKNQQQESYIDRLERQLRILLELKGISLKEIKASLDRASEAEAHGEMRNRVKELTSQLEVNELDKSFKRNTDVSFFEKKAVAKKMANLELQVGELKEVEGSMRSEVAKIYEALQEQTANVTRLESKCSEQETLIDNMRRSKPAVFQDEHVHQPTDKESVLQRNLVEDGEANKLQDLLREAQLQLQLGKDKSKLLEEHAYAKEMQLNLRNDQFQARLLVQDEDIVDLKQQLSSLYAAFDVLQREKSHEENRRQALEKILHEADMTVARRISKDDVMSGLSTTVTHTPYTSMSPPLSPPVQEPPSASSRSPQTAKQLTLTSNHHENQIHRPPQSLSHAVLAGNLWKLDQTMFKKWKKRYFVLSRVGDGNYRLSYKEEHTSKAKVCKLTPGTSTIRKIPGSNSKFHKRNFCFVLTVDSQCPGLYLASDKLDFNRWTNALSSALTVSFDTTGASLNKINDDKEDEEMALAKALSLSEGF